jgi:Mor family transcriptional regulator
MAELDFEIETLNDAYKEFARLIGIENTHKMFQNFRGQQITFPMRWLSPEHIAVVVAERYDGKNLKELAKEYGYSERWLRQILKKHRGAVE